MNPGQRLRIGTTAAAVILLVTGCTTSTADAPPSPSTTSPTATPSVIDPSSLNPTNTSPTPPAPSPPPTDAPSPNPTPPGISAQEAADRAAVEATWAKFWQVSDNLTRIVEEDRRTEISSVAMDPTLSQALEDARSLDAKGREIYGQSVFHPYWQQPINGATTAVMGDCTDTSGSGARDKESGKVRTVGVSNNNTRVTFVRAPDGTWRVHEIFYLVDAPCP